MQSFAIGNAPTALFHLLEMIDRGAARPALIVGIPVGFVGAVEFKGCADHQSARRADHRSARPARRQCHGGGSGQCRGRGVGRMSKAWLTIIGIGDDGINSLTPPALALVKAAGMLIAPQRVLDSLDLAALGLDGCEIVPWTMGVGPTLELLKSRRGTPVTMLATGDPMHFGIGATMRRSLEAEEMLVIPTPSGFSLAAARMGWGAAGCRLYFVARPRRGGTATAYPA